MDEGCEFGVSEGKLLLVLLSLGYEFRDAWRLVEWELLERNVDPLLHGW